MSNNSIRVGIYVDVAKVRFDCLFFPSSRSAVAIKMPHNTSNNRTGIGTRHCEVSAKNEEEAKIALQKELGDGSW